MSGSVATARPTQALRVRRESQRPAAARTGTKPPVMDDQATKPDTRRYVSKQVDVLAKYSGKPPSLRVFLHPNHFRINDSQETLSYASPMKELLQAIRDKVVPHNMVEDLLELNIPWYDGCLIVEVHDYRSTGIKPKDDANGAAEAGSNSFSIHNYNNFITPSPFAPFPSGKPDTKPAPAPSQGKDADTKEDKENMPAPNQNGPPQKQRPKKFTVVLFPTPQSQLADIQILATTPVPDMAAIKRMQAAGRTGGLPPTPLTAVPPTPTFPNGPSPKRQKMLLDDSNIHEFEAEVYNATCPKLYLEPTKSFAESLALMDAITHPNNKNPAPPRKTRKRTTAELAADEAEAQDLQRFMLAADGHQATTASAATGNDDSAGRAAANSQTFSRFKTIMSIRATHEEVERRKKEEEARIAQAKRQAQEEAAAQKQRDAEASRQQAEVMERQQQLLRQQQLQQQQLQQNEAMRAASAAQQQMSNAAQLNQTPQSLSQPQFSPVLRQQTPMVAAAASPHVGAQVSHAMGSTPMVASASNNAVASPARPPSAVSHHQNQMARSVSQQQNMSRTGTPQMVQGTPVMGASMPNRNMTPTPSRINQGSPSISMQGQTPMMMNTPQPGQNMTPEAIQQLQAQQRMQQLRMQQMQQAGGSPGNQQLQQLALQKAHMHIQQQGVPAGQNPQTYRQQLAQNYLRQLSQQHAQQQQQQAALANMSPQGVVAHGGVPQQPTLNVNNLSLQQMRQQFAQRKQTLIQQFGPTNIPPNYMQQMQQLEAAINVKMRQEQAQQAQLQQQMNPGGIQGQMGNQMNGQMNGMQNVTNPLQVQQQQQQYHQLLQQQRANEARRQQMMQMQQRALAQNGQIPQGMMNNMQQQGMNMGNMTGNMGGGMAGMQGMNMAQMQGQMQQMQGMQGMQGMNISQMNPQQMQQMMMMRQAQQQAQRQSMQPQQGNGGGDINWSGV
ncbi:hypothetical protein IAQ61_005238 [Plenodomus lingam]|uniref:Spt20-like SEP domain-containing protein n=1 Tax=Leptosphaeria maculans (strain JN3 / isolate v23.1.3 / race Av1-4-5-6-7-8) TaxID=985895 RepID=E5A7B4_LEPMJ|nr:hypothetical protein LEMA_P087480.1 [Plenodomus lingam JN3]KAH9872403.1 hypothetical protein IAQ61_005238 [Plenodomus lingam]CBX99509.1 hypothetical protein LEMA_P087480.1 [Plenodomus lingam JN3]